MSSIFKDSIFDGKVAFVTGGATGICYGMTEALMRHGANATILGRRANVVAESAKTLSRTTGRKCIGVSGDVRDPESLKKAVEATIKEFGRIDFVICGAAGNFLSPIDGMSENAFQTVMSIDTLGTYNTVKATIEEVKKTKGSYIATVAAMRQIPMQRLGVLADVADAGIYLFSGAASYVTGACLVVDGGAYHTSGGNTRDMYPDMLLKGGDFRAALASKL
ncbi:hypothetical protein RQP46_003396 [Phenoliferia psychrophenolica]